MDNVQTMMEGNNFFIFLIVLVALMGIFILVGNVIKTFRELKKPRDDDKESLTTEVKTLEMKVEHIEERIGIHSIEIEDIRRTNRVLCQGVRALLNHQLHDGNTDEMRQASVALENHLTDKI